MRGQPGSQGPSSHVQERREDSQAQLGARLRGLEPVATPSSLPHWAPRQAAPPPPPPWTPRDSDQIVPQEP